ncbi:MAG: 3-oxoacyl-ACP reductase [Zetaproteobacteria bacterium CG1_02_53_45]|nr:MAG: 3-oxoacyl-ACP reductase [Zetaproteobacteria bacterium CG1_02_53_45]
MTKHVLVTGASRGIGAAIACRLAAADRHIWINYRSSESDAESVAVEIRARGFEASILHFDVSDRAGCKSVLEAFAEEYGGFDVIVNNAGITADAPFPGMEDEQWDSVMQTSLGGFYNVLRPLVMPMIRKRWGRIVNMTSIAALHGNRGQTNYAAAKAGVIGATKSLARELASRGICVNAVAPGFIDTEMSEHISRDIIRQSVPMGRAGSVQEVAEVVSFLCSDGASYVTGEVINVSGGII